MEAKLFKAKKADRTIVLECNGRACTNSDDALRAK